MKDILTASRVANRIRLARTQHTGSFLIVEGDTDARVYGNFVDNSACSIVVAYGKENAIEVIALLEKGGVVGILAIVDADFDLIENRAFNSLNLFLTDTHDLETMMLKSPALEKLLLEIGSENKQSEFKRKRGNEVRHVLLEEGTHIGYLRWVSLRHNHALKFEELNYRAFTNLATLTIDQPALIKTIKDHSQKLKLLDEELRGQIEAIRDDAHEKWTICCGHDLIGILSVGLHKALGSRNWKEIEAEILERSLRLAYESIWFRSTRLYTSIKNWEERNASFRVFALDEMTH